MNKWQYIVEINDCKWDNHISIDRDTTRDYVVGENISIGSRHPKLYIEEIIHRFDDEGRYEHTILICEKID